jgi:hypothetical protein
LDREYLEDYEQRELREYESFLKKMQKGEFSFDKDRYPPKERFIKPQKPMALTTLETTHESNIWFQVPFCGSLILPVPAWPMEYFEKALFKVSEIPKMIDFIKDTGKIQMILETRPLNYVGLDYLDPFFVELEPPEFILAPFSMLGTQKEIEKAEVNFRTLASVKYFSWVKRYMLHGMAPTHFFSQILSQDEGVYVTLKLMNFTSLLVEDLESAIIDDPEKAYMMFGLYKQFITDPIVDVLSDMTNLSLKDIRETQYLSSAYRPQKIQFPCEIGKFLLRKLTYAPQGLRACYDLIDRYDSYDLQKVQESLNEAIITNHPDIVNKSAEELSEILDNVWNDPTIPKQVKNLRRGVPMSIAAIGTAVSAFTGNLEGFLAGLGFSVGAKFLDIEIEGLSERLVKFFARSHQANIYDFKKKYKDKITYP